MNPPSRARDRADGDSAPASGGRRGHGHPAGHTVDLHHQAATAGAFDRPAGVADQAARREREGLATGDDLQPEAIGELDTAQGFLRPLPRERSAVPVALRATRVGRRCVTAC